MYDEMILGVILYAVTTSSRQESNLFVSFVKDDPESGTIVGVTGGSPMLPLLQVRDGGTSGVKHLLISLISGKWQNK